jgi:peptidoglycan/xylan/chitin deacetylase (PgdA/CDA1 family)
MVNSPRIIVQHPDTRMPERRYILDVVFRRFLGLEYESFPAATDATTISVVGTEAHDRLVVKDVLLQVPADQWLSRCSLPSQPLERWRVGDCLPEVRVVSHEIPVIYGEAMENGTFYRRDNQGIVLGVDVFGSAFFMLTRYEEIVNADRDSHNRFPATASLAYQVGFLDRPIIDEYVEILWSCMTRLWPRLERRQRQYRLVLSHDVDCLLAVLNRSWPEVVRSSAGDLLRRRDIGLAWNRMCARMGCAFGHYDRDPFNTFGFLMGVSEKSGIASTFYFISDHSGNDRIDGYYRIDMPWIGHLMRTMHSRGHEIGLHGSYGSYEDGTQIGREFRRLLEVAKRENIEQPEWGSRQHYLRWATPITWRILGEAGVSYDSTLSFADHIGFRCGVCHEYEVYDLENREVLNLRERPLIAIDVSLTGPAYMHLHLDGAYDLVKTMSERCKSVDGDFTFLCHNNTVSTISAKRFYSDVVKACK